MKKERLHYLFNLYLDQSTSPEQEVELMHLLSDHTLEEEWRRLVEQCYDTVRAEHDLSGEAAQRIFSLITDPASSGRPAAGKPAATPVFLVKKGWFRYAAAVALLLCTGAYFWISQARYSEPVAGKATNHPADVPPGGNKAILTLADGSRIVLDAAATGTLARQDGTEILKLDSGLLAYNADNHREAPVQYNTVQTPKGGQYRIILPDGSMVWLNALSSLRYPTSFQGDQRKVEVTGEAYFEVVSAPKGMQGRIPFIVQFSTPSENEHPGTENAGGQVEVLGTQFNINAYPDETYVSTSLLEGKVRISLNSQTQMLSPGQQSKVKADGSDMQLIKNAPVNDAVAWKNGFFHFENADLKSVMRQLQRWYDIDIVYEKNIDMNEVFFGEIGRDLNLSEVLKLLREMDVNFRIEGKKLIVSS